jgi:hypothetical protein
MESGTDRTALAATRLPEWFRARSPREILQRLANGDPLGLRLRTSAYLERHAYLLEADALHLRAMAVIARASPRMRGPAEAEAWLEERIAEAATELIEEPVRYPSEASAFEQLARPLGLDPCSLRRACARFNQLPEPERQAFFGIVIRRQSIEALALARGESALDTGRRARRVLDLFLNPAAPEGVRES